MNETVLLVVVGVVGLVVGFVLRALTGRPKAAALPAPAPAQEKPPELPADGGNAGALFLLSMLQREGRFIDFVQEEIASHADADVGAVARVVHEGCRKVVRQYLALDPVVPQSEGDAIDVKPGFDAQRIRLTGNVSGQPPYKGSLKHHGWIAKSVSLPPPPKAIDPKILAPAEVELP